MSYLAMQMDEVSRDETTKVSPSFLRFDMEKQKYFKWRASSYRQYLFKKTLICTCNDSLLY